jgi:hypothetical protein
MSFLFLRLTLFGISLPRLKAWIAGFGNVCMIRLVASSLFFEKERASIIFLVKEVKFEIRRKYIQTV